MLIKINSFKKIDRIKLMDIYSEGNIENIDYFYSDMSDKNEALKRIEDNFLNYIKENFFKNIRNKYMILEVDGIWVSALRLYYVEDGLYYIEALETHPEYRKKGYGAKLLLQVLDLLKETGGFKICDCIRKENIASLATHKKCGFEIVSEKGYDYLQKESDERSYGMEYTY